MFDLNFALLDFLNLLRGTYLTSHRPGSTGPWLIERCHCGVAAAISGTWSETVRVTDVSYTLEMQPIPFLVDSVDGL
jgi:hypothetical protein